MSRKVLLSFAAALLMTQSPAAAQEPPRMLPSGPGTVTLSRAEYDRLLDLAARRPGGPDTAPVAAALTRADIRVRVSGAAARATMHVDGEVFRPGVARVTLIKGATLLEARMDNRPLPIVPESGAHVALLSGPAAFSATLEVGSAVAFAPGRASFSLPVPDAGSATATIDVPGEQTDVHLSSGLILRRTSTAGAGGRTTIEATLMPGVTTEVWWSTHDTVPATTARDVRLLADIKSIVSIGDADIRLVSLVNATIVQGEPAQIAVAIPAGYEVASVSGASLERSDTQSGRVVLFLADPASRRHQFLISLERPHDTGSFTLETGFPAIPSAQRETGEVGVEGLGTLELKSADVAGLRRIDVREVDPALASIARQPLLAAYRYQRTSEEPPVLPLDIRRFADAPVLAAVAERAVATTLVTTEGRALTDVTLWVRNRAQAFMKVALPPGSTLLSVEVAGAPAKPVEGKDGTRVPLLRPGFRPDGSYMVSFVYLHAGTAFQKKGEMQMTLPKMDVPINVVEWELFVPDRYRVEHFDGSMMDASLMIARTRDGHGASSASGSGGGMGSGIGGGTSAPAPLRPARSGEIVGRLTDRNGAPLPGGTVIVEAGGGRWRAVTDGAGAYAVSNLPSGRTILTAQLPGFNAERRELDFDQRGQQVDMMLEVGSVTEAVAVNASPQSSNSRKEQQRAQDMIDAAPSINVQNLQRLASGVLPVRMEVPRAGTSHRFVKPLVIDEETQVTFRYKRR